MKGFFVLIGILALAISGCQAKAPVQPTKTPISVNQTCALFFSNSGLCAELTWIEKPQGPTKATFEIRFFQSSDPQQLTTSINYNVNVEFLMPSMGHGLGSRPFTMTETSPGLFTVTDVYFSMPGDWEITILLISNEQQIVDQSTYAFIL
ncbi:MAG: FixH family protein [Pseudobdellovibrionaceae bacterium]|nr:FixH family protein [Bdellovibrionales bacterium]USN46089.1 MAG: FixH family protein [Pseudobdellovibrionaceae bacterium]